MTAPAPSLTDAERLAVRLAGELYTHIAENVVGPGPARDADLAEICRSIHDIQYRIEAQATARAYPGEFRLLGEDPFRPARRWFRLLRAPARRRRPGGPRSRDRR